MEQEVATCLVCLTELQAETEIVALNCLYDENVTYGDCIKFCAMQCILDSFGEILDKNMNSVVCNDCSIELEISYKFLNKLTHTYDILSQAYKSTDAQQEILILPTNEKQETPDEEECLIEYAEANDWTTEDVNEEQESQNEGQEIINFIITEQEEEDNKAHIEAIVNREINIEPQSAAGNNEDDLIEEIPYEEIEVYTNNSDKEISPSLLMSGGSEKLRNYICDYCGKVFPNHTRMSAHRRVHERNRTTFNCFECGRMYASDQALTVHVRSAHNKEGFTCPFCSKVFFNERSLEIHTRYHTKTFPYDCKDCGKNFAQKGHLNTHQNVRHNGLRFICVYPNCNKLFTSSAALRDHEFSHNLKPFECQYCQGGYTSKSKLKAHIRQVHNLELTLEELEPMRKFHVMRSKPNCVLGVAESD